MLHVHVAIQYRPFLAALDRWIHPFIVLNCLAKLGTLGKLQVRVFQLLTGVANAINGLKYPKGAPYQHSVNAHTAVTHTCGKATMIRRPHHKWEIFRSLLWFHC